MPHKVGPKVFQEVDMVGVERGHIVPEFVVGHGPSINELTGTSNQLTTISRQEIGAKHPQLTSSGTPEEAYRDTIIQHSVTLRVDPRELKCLECVQTFQDYFEKVIVSKTKSHHPCVTSSGRYNRDQGQLPRVYTPSHSAATNHDGQKYGLTISTLLVSARPLTVIAAVPLEGTFIGTLPTLCGENSLDSTSR
jgi:hypothetical protein